MKRDGTPNEWFSNVSFHRASRKAFTSLLSDFHDKTSSDPITPLYCSILLIWEQLPKQSDSQKHSHSFKVVKRKMFSVDHQRGYSHLAHIKGRYNLMMFYRKPNLCPAMACYKS